MPWKNFFLFQIGTLALAFCAILNAQPGTSSKWANAPHNHRVAKCVNCVRDLGGHISQNPAPVRKFRSTHPCPADGSLQGPCPGYVVDYAKPLDRGGKNVPDNMRWRTIAQVEKEEAKTSKGKPADLPPRAELHRLLE